MGRIRGLTGGTGAILAVLGRRCRSCGRVSGVGPDGLCEDCGRDLAPRTGGYCPRCGELYDDSESSPHPCAECLRAAPPWSGFFFHGEYTGRLREMILGLKFNDRIGTLALLGSFLARAGRTAGLGGVDVVLPVPLHYKRLRERGYNQSLELARALARERGWPLDAHGLVRVRQTIPQTGLTRAG
ncbi:MAG: ComF family protein, partial [Deltaproteobacteria bacterium]|nr:ComF family protein [Deltaproteobacteria bacterium]